MAIYNRPNLYPFIVAQSMPLETQQQLMGLFWALALAVILLILFVGIMMALFRVIRRRSRLNEQSQDKPKADNAPDPWGESGKRMGHGGGDFVFDDEDASDASEDQHSEDASDDEPK